MKSEQRFFLLLLVFSLCVSAFGAAPTSGQTEVRVYNGSGFTQYGVTLTNGQALGWSGGVPAAITPTSDWSSISSKPATITTLATGFGAIFTGAGVVRWTGSTYALIDSSNKISDSDISSAASWNAKQNGSTPLTALSAGFGSPSATGIPYWNGSTYLEMSASSLRNAAGLGNVENTALSTWAGSANITTLGTLSAGAIPTSLLTGTISASQLANTAVTAGSYTAANITVDAQGRITAASNGSSTTTLTGDVTGSGSGSFATTLANSGVTAGSYTNASVTFDAKGRATAASSGHGIADIQSVTKTDVFTGTATTWTNITTLTVTVTTLSSSDKVILSAVIAATANNSNEVLFLRIARDGNPVTQGDARGVRTRAMANVISVGSFRVPSVTMGYVDTPGSVGTFVYTVQYILSGSGTTLCINASGSDANATFEGTMVSTLTAQLYH